MLRCSRYFLSPLVLAAAFVTAHAAELGEARVSSHIGQPLVADIELAMIDDPAQAVAVRVASPEVYSGAGIAVPPVLGNLNLSVMRRDGRQFLHVTSLRPVDSEHLHLYLELSDKGQRTVRLATLWLTPDPNPAPVPRAAPAAMPASAAVPAAAAIAAAPVRKPAAVRKPEPLAAGHAEEEGAKQPQPAPAKVRPQARPAAAPVHVEAKAAAALPLPIHAPQAAAPAACVQQLEQAKVCAALDGKNAELNQKIGALEGRVKSLQATLGAAAPVAHGPKAEAAKPSEPAAVKPAEPTAEKNAEKSAEPAHAPEAVKEPPGPKPISAIKPLVPRKHKTPPPEPESGLPWGWIGIGAALLLALGAAAAVLRRRARTVRNVGIPAGPRLIDRVRHSFTPRTRSAQPAAQPAAPEAAAEAVEPSFE